MPVPQDESHSLHAPQSLSVQSITVEEKNREKQIYTIIEAHSNKHVKKFSLQINLYIL